MKTITRKKALAMGLLVLLLTSALFACGHLKPVEPTTAQTVRAETTPASEVTVQVAAPTAETAADTTATTHLLTTVTSETSTATAPPATTTAITKKVALSISEIVKIYNNSANAVKIDKPGLRYQMRTFIEADKLTSTNALIDTVAPTIISMAKGIWDKWNPETVIAKGANCDNDFPVRGQNWSSKLNPDWVKNADCTEKDGVYTIRIELKDERVPALPDNMTSTHHGQVMKVFEKNEIAGGAEKIGITLTKFDSKYTGNYILCDIDANTGHMKSATYHTYCEIDITVHLVGSISAYMPLGQESVYTINAY